MAPGAIRSGALKQSVQTLRGAACIFLVAYHAIGSSAASGLHMADGTVLRHLADSFIYLRMPLFAFVAGLVYTFRSISTGQSIGGFLAGKARRLLIPMLVASSLQFALAGVTEGQGSAYFLGILWLPVFPYEHYWFLQAMFLIFALTALLDSFGVLASRAAIVLLMVAAGIVSMSDVVQVRFMATHSAFYLLPFFLLGLYFGRFGDPLARRGGVAVALLLVVVGLVTTQAGLLGFLDHAVPREGAMAILFGAAFCMLIMRTGWTNRGLQYVGKYSYSIYLFHMFAVAPLRVALPKLGIEQPYLLFVLMVVGGLSAPILVEMVAGRFTVTRFLLLGQKPLPRPAAHPATVAPTSAGEHARVG